MKKLLVLPTKVLAHIETSTLGKINAYTCQNCNTKTITTNGAKGVTPFMIDCETCKHGNAYSCMYQTDQNQEPTHEWYRPTHIENKFEEQHLLQGGLLLRKLKTCSTMVPTETQEKTHTPQPRNVGCECGSGKKYKRCCIYKQHQQTCK